MSVSLYCVFSLIFFVCGAQIWTPLQVASFADEQLHGGLLSEQQPPLGRIGQVC